jgi:hypothetical protein
MKAINSAALILAVVLIAPRLPGQTDSMQDMPGMNGASAGEAMQSMDGHPMHMGSHMKMTALRGVQPGDQNRAQEVAEAARAVCEKYKDYKLALADGFRIFLPNVPQKQYHFTKYEYAREAAEHFNPEHPTSLLYEKAGDGYKLIGVMYTAPRWTGEDELNQRIPLSIAQWHAHVNLCLAASGLAQTFHDHDSRFGLNGSISTQADCSAAGGRFVPQIFGWMVHVYPFAQQASQVWSVERQMRHED